MDTVYINNVVKQMKTDLRLIEEQQPLIHNITNYVAMNFVANSLLAIGASPIMARAEEEVEEISSKSNALALNLGIPESTTAHSMILAGEAAMKKSGSATKGGATSWGFHLELTEHLDDIEISNICSQLPLSADYEGEGINGSVLSLYNY